MHLHCTSPLSILSKVLSGVKALILILLIASAFVIKLLGNNFFIERKLVYFKPPVWLTIVKGLHVSVCEQTLFGRTLFLDVLWRLFRLVLVARVGCPLLLLLLLLCGCRSSSVASFVVMRPLLSPVEKSSSQNSYYYTK